MEKKELHRRSIRLPGADYREAGGYFITICTAERNEIFGSIKDGEVLLSELGKIVRACLVQIPNHFAHASIEEYVVMPNHVHVIIALGVGARYIVPLHEGARSPERFQKPVKGSIPTIVRTFKAAVVRQAGKELGMHVAEIWQRNYFERVLRNGQEYANASRYVAENPMRWEWDAENPRRKDETRKEGHDVSCPYGKMN
ncbi:MAG TPA: transposase [Candidatus Acidoferrum sp.]|nr:transposase [Candidatus Acidoferrum sp.]